MAHYLHILVTVSVFIFIWLYILSHRSYSLYIGALFLSLIGVVYFLFSKFDDNSIGDFQIYIGFFSSILGGYMVFKRPIAYNLVINILDYLIFIYLALSIFVNIFGLPDFGVFSLTTYKVAIFNFLSLYYLLRFIDSGKGFMLLISTMFVFLGLLWLGKTQIIFFLLYAMLLFKYLSFYRVFFLLILILTISFYALTVGFDFDLFHFWSSRVVNLGEVNVDLSSSSFVIDSVIRDGGRFEMWADLLHNMLNNAPLFGLGLGDRAFSGDIEDHNFIVFLLSRFGLLFGFAIILIYWIFIRRSVKKILNSDLHFFYLVSLSVYLLYAMVGTSASKPMAVVSFLMLVNYISLINRRSHVSECVT
jgi:hypothetical protein